MSDDNKKLKCPHCDSTFVQRVDMKDAEFDYYQCRFCGGYCHIPKKPEPKVWE